ncbi:MAG TPA: hypothetical protein VGJ20_41205 [Xanthobacteraceae bacterium]|jgi:hypothetical protein
MTGGGRVRLAVVSGLFILAVAIVGRVYGQHLAYRDMLARDSAIQQLEAERQKLEVERANGNGQVATLEAKLSSVQAALNEIVPSKDTYDISPNQSLIVAGGHLTIGLVGSPSSDGIIINVNGKQQRAVVGDDIHVAVDSSTSCTIGVQSFDLFKAIVTASCAPAVSQ